MSQNGSKGSSAPTLGPAPASDVPPRDLPADAPLSIVLFSGTDDRLEAAAVLVVGAAAMGRPVHVFLQYWAVDAFRAGRTTVDHGFAPEAPADGIRRLQQMRSEGRAQHWSELLAQAKDLGEVSIHACALSMDAFGLQAGDLDPMVDGVQGVAAFMAGVTGPLVFV